MMKSSVVQDSSELKVTVFWGDVLYDTAVFRSNAHVTLGRKKDSSFYVDVSQIEGTGKDQMQVANILPGKKLEFLFNDRMEGHLKLEGELMSFHKAKTQSKIIKNASGYYTVVLSENDKADFVIGHLSFYFSWVNRSTQVMTEARDWRKLIPFAGAFAFVLLLAIGISFWTPPEPEKPPERLVTLIPPKGMAAKAAVGERKSETGGAQSGETGKAELKVKKENTVAEELQKENVGSAISKLTGLGKQAPAVADHKGGATAAVAQVGTGGSSTEGLKTGGGGKSIGIGRAVGRGEGGFEGSGRLGLSGTSPVEGGTGHGVEGGTQREGLPRDVIEAVIRRRIDRIRLCYERQLNFQPKLAGKMVIHFVIAADGSVMTSRVSEDTMKSPPVKSCVEAEVKSWTFPRPEGGVTVNVDYPFVFESSAKN